MTAHPLTEARELQQAADTDWRAVAEEGILDVLRRQETVHGDDIADLGIPDAHNKERGLAFSALRFKGMIATTEVLRASKQRSRKAGKSFIYRKGPNFPYPATAGVEGGNAPEFSHVGSDASGYSLHSGGAGVGGRGEPGRNSSAAVKAPDSASSGKIAGVGADSARDTGTAFDSPVRPLGVSADPGECSPGIRQDNAAPVQAASAGSSAIPGEPTPLFEMPPERPPHDRVAEAA